MRRAYAAAAMCIALAACSSPEQADVPAPTANEQRALAEAESMIPPSEIPPATGTPSPTQSGSR